MLLQRRKIGTEPAESPALAGFRGRRIHRQSSSANFELLILKAEITTHTSIEPDALQSGLSVSCG
jgi:hypothetical protein